MQKRTIGRWLPITALLFGASITVVSFAAETYDHLAARRPAKSRQLTQGESLEVWSVVAGEACALDHTPVAPGENRTFGEQVGPGRSARAMAIVHIAMFEAMNAIDRRYQSFTGVDPVARSTTIDERAAVAQAAYDTLVELYPSQELLFKARLDKFLGATRNQPSTRRGLALGRRCAASILSMRMNDGSDHDEPTLDNYHTRANPGDWQQDPIAKQNVARGAFWASVRPFVMPSAEQFRAPPPPALSSAAYAAAFNEVLQLGGDGITTPTIRTPEQTEIGIYWGYTGTPGLGTPSVLYNQITRTIAKQRGTTGVDYARLLALVNVAVADAGIAIWESKYFYNLWRPVTGIREAHRDNNTATIPNPKFTPLGAPATNLTGPDFTPPFPAYPSEHAGFGGATFEMLRAFYGTDNVGFSFVSDEFNGKNRDNDGRVRPLMTRSFQTLSQAEEENGQSPIYLGIHWQFDKTAGIRQGNSVADYVYAHAFQRLP